MPTLRDDLCVPKPEPTYALRFDSINEFRMGVKITDRVWGYLIKSGTVKDRWWPTEHILEWMRKRGCEHEIVANEYILLTDRLLPMEEWKEIITKLYNEEVGMMSVDKPSEQAVAEDPGPRKTLEAIHSEELEAQWHAIEVLLDRAHCGDKSMTLSRRVEVMADQLRMQRAKASRVQQVIFDKTKEMQEAGVPEMRFEDQFTFLFESWKERREHGKKDKKLIEDLSGGIERANGLVDSVVDAEAKLARLGFDSDQGRLTLTHNLDKLIAAYASSANPQAAKASKVIDELLDREGYRDPSMDLLQKVDSLIKDRNAAMKQNGEFMAKLQASRERQASLENVLKGVNDDRIDSLRGESEAAPVQP